MAGLSELNREFRPKCPTCGSSIDLREYWNTLFDRILGLLAAGERVCISGFGSFEAKPYGGWTIKGLDGEEKKVTPRQIIRFYASALAKKRINKQA